MTKTITYKAEDIFQNIECDEKNVLMTIPPEVAERAGFEPGDVLKIEILEDGALSITKKENNGEEQ
jgi:hypothetical protein